MFFVSSLSSSGSIKVVFVMKKQEEEKEGNLLQNDRTSLRCVKAFTFHHVYNLLCESFHFLLQSHSHKMIQWHRKIKRTQTQNADLKEFAPAINYIDVFYQICKITQCWISACYLEGLVCCAKSYARNLMKPKWNSSALKAIMNLSVWDLKSPTSWIKFDWIL